MSRLRSLVLVVVVGCSLRDPPSTRPAAPLPADPPIQLDTMQAECDALVAALEAYRGCKYHEDKQRRAIERWIENAQRSFAASRKASPEPNAQRAIAGACRRATTSVTAANARCLAGPPPDEDRDRDPDD